MNKPIALLLAVLLAMPVYAPTTPAVGGPTGGMILLPTTPQPTLPAQVRGLILENPQSVAIPARMITFGQVFGAGQVPAGRQLVASIGTVTKPVQMDVKTTNPDGSPASVVLTMLQPALAANAWADVMLNLAPSGTMPAAALNFSKLTDVVATITVHGKLNTVFTIDPSTALTQALAARKASYWLQGPQAVQARVDTPITGSFHVVIDITVFADGTSSIDFQFNNDYAMQPRGGEIVYDLSIAQDGKVLFAQAGIDQVQYTTWSKIFYSNGPVQVNIQQDILALERTGAIQAYNLATGVSASTISGDVASLSNGNFGILGIGKIARDMTGTGGRGDIGSQPDWMCNWLTTQSAGAAQFALAQAEAGGTIPWHLFNPKTGHYTTVVDYPKLYTGYNNNSSGGTIGLTQPRPPSSNATPVPAGTTPFTVDIAHEPDVAYVPYLMTGRRYWLDQLNAEASYDELTFNNNFYLPTQFGQSLGIVVSANTQVRTAAWALREIVEAAFINPTGSPDKATYTAAMSNSFAYLLAEAAASNEGEVSGWFQGVYGDNNGIMAPWQQDYLASTVILAAEQGVVAAREVLAWEANFLVNRFLEGANGFSPYDGAAYNITLFTGSGNGSKGALKSWAAIGAKTVAAGESYGGSWTKMGGDYGALAQETLAGILTVAPTPAAKQAYTWVSRQLAAQWPTVYPQMNVVPLH